MPYYDDVDQQETSALGNRQNIHVQVNAADISDDESYDNYGQEQENFSKQFSAVIFEDQNKTTNPNNNNLSLEEIDCAMPKLKAPDKGKPVSDKLAQLVSTSCTALCETDSLISTYKVPENCEMASPPLINQEVWKVLDKKSHMNDKILVGIQNLVAAGLGTVIKLTELIKGNISSEAKGVISDTFTVLGQVQYNLSLRRRYAIRPLLKKMYASLCQSSMPITTKLFGDDISKEVKNCDNLSSLGNSFTQRSPLYGLYGGGFRGRGRFSRRGYNTSYRTQPYPMRGQPGYRSMSRPRPFRRIATATAPNDLE
ncbi:uncharacterized protein LOC123557402 [Mercenaria mercenaria]|uniref:uncharacterized protein LOC123557402 n=1 Tax=Mercenaria mercenaria TaxID=6596 RepID=UPI00234E9D4A|nr:uncharacterized protein LOC123557402 [Mercenaria mercenaria]